MSFSFFIPKMHPAVVSCSCTVTVLLCPLHYLGERYRSTQSAGRYTYAGSGQRDHDRVCNCLSLSNPRLVISTGVFNNVNSTIPLSGTVPCRHLYCPPARDITQNVICVLKYRGSTGTASNRETSREEHLVVPVLADGMGLGSSQRTSTAPSVSTESTSLISSQSCSPVSTNFGGTDDSEGDMVTCPTCGGAGKIRRRDSQQLIALIPYQDKRLKPRRRPIFYIVITVVVCLIAAGLLTFFLLPRSVAMQVEHPSIVTHSDFFHNSLTILVNFTLKLTNNNYLKAQLYDLSVQVMQASLCVGQFVLNKTTVDMLTTQAVHCSTQLTFRGQHASDVRDLCKGDYRNHKLTVIFQTAATYKYLSDTEGISHYSYFQLYCTSPTTIVPTNKTLLL